MGRRAWHAFKKRIPAGVPNKLLAAGLMMLATAAATPPADAGPEAPLTARCRAKHEAAAAQAMRGDHAGALEAFYGMVKQCPGVCAAMNRLGTALAARNEPASARLWFARAAECDPGNAAFQRNMTN